jgi:molecular chaperone GrpE (heat shock protein)
MVMNPQPEIPAVLQHKLGADGANALTEMMQIFWRERLRELEDAAWQRTENRLARVEAAIEQLAEAQRRTEERVERLEAVVERLAEAQRRTEERVERLEAAVERLAEAQRRTEEQVAALVIAQRRTEKGMRQLTEGMDALRRQVGALSENVGFGLEGIARIVLPGYLERHLGMKVLGPLGEELNPRILGPEGQEDEFDLYGVGLRDGEEVTIVGEVKSRIYSDDVYSFLQRIEKVSPALPEKMLSVLFGYNVHPRAREEAEKVGLLLVAAYQR